MYAWTIDINTDHVVMHSKVKEAVIATPFDYLNTPKSFHFFFLSRKLNFHCTNIHFTNIFCKQFYGGQFSYSHTGKLYRAIPLVFNHHLTRYLKRN